MRLKLSNSELPALYSAGLRTQLAKKAGLSLPTVKRVENVGGARVSDLARHALQRALETGGVDFIDENGGGPGVRLRGRTRAKKAR